METAQQLPLKDNSRLYSPVAASVARQSIGPRKSISLKETPLNAKMDCHAALAMTAQVAQIIYKFFTLTP
jgi:hypothetical protein